MTTQQPESLRLANVCNLLTRYSMDAHLIAAELRRQHARIAELEAQLESIRAGGVNGPLMGKPQEMPDLSALTERGAKAWAGVDAQGLRDGVASAGSEPVAVDGWLHENGLLYRLTDERHPRNRDEINVTMADGLRSIESRSRRALELLDRIRAARPSPPEGMVGGWMPIETAPKDGTRILLHPAVEVHDAWSKGYWSEQHECWIVGGSASGLIHTYWHALPPSPPTTSAGSKGE